MGPTNNAVRKVCNGESLEAIVGTWILETWLIFATVKLPTPVKTSKLLLLYTDNTSTNTHTNTTLKKYLYYL